MTPPPVPTFRIVFRGYDPEQVDALLTRCARTLGTRAGEFPELAAAGRSPVSDPRPLTAEDLHVAQFRVRFRGYALDDVDDLLDRLADRVARA